MKYLAIILVLFGSFEAIKSDENEFPPPVIPHNCGIPDCSIQSNRYHEKALFPHPDPEKYYQCVPFTLNDWYPMERYCICGTVFNARLSRCSYWWDEGWEPICDWEVPPNFTPCDQPHKDKWATW